MYEEETMSKDVVNQILLGDCLEQMRFIKKSSIDLIYLDPPFFTERTHSLKNRTRSKEFSFDDTWGNSTRYADFIKQRIVLMHEILKEDGSIFIHCDKSGAHIIRLILDQVFGEQNFQSEIIWSYKRWSNARKGLLPTHQNIYFYSKSKTFTFNTIYTDYSETTNIDQILQKRKRDQDNKSVYEFDKQGRFKMGDKKKGVPLSDVWDIPYLNPKAKERVGYPTQKPLLLLERIITIASNKGDLVLDPFCGSGTTCVAAQLLGRKFIGIDQSQDAVALAQSRLANPIKTESKLLKKGRKSYVNVDQEALKILERLDFHPVHRNKGIDAILTERYDEKPVLVRVQKKNEALSEAAALLAKAMKTKQSTRSFLVQTSNGEEWEEQIKYDGMIILPALAFQIQNLLK